LRPHIHQRGLHVISRVAHRSRAVGEPGVFEALQRSVEKPGDDRLRLAALGDLHGGRSGGSDLVALMLTGSGTSDRHYSSEAEDQKKDASIHHSLPAKTC
jgi:hypothetical protein